MILAEQPDKSIILALQHETSYPACSDAIKILTRKDPTLESYYKRILDVPTYIIRGEQPG